MVEIVNFKQKIYGKIKRAKVPVMLYCFHTE